MNTIPKLRKLAKVLNSDRLSIHFGSKRAIIMQNNSSPKPTIEYWHVWTDNDGISHQSRCQIEDFQDVR
ncbi:MAG: hypothetical protein V7K97_03095 [Nostoc sp.]|uniref:hypothetical protein n=1 Tax=Nostoc sp. TaxID=1180 RepID=UPI002FFAA789